MVRLPLHSGTEFHFGMCVRWQKRLRYMGPNVGKVQKMLNHRSIYENVASSTHTFQNGIPFRNGSLAVP